MIMILLAQSKFINIWFKFFIYSKTYFFIFRPSFLLLYIVFNFLIFILFKKNLI